MTIVISILTPDGIVLASDSRQIVHSVSKEGRVDSDNVQKIFQLNQYLGLVYWGQGNFYTDKEKSPRSFYSLIKSAAKNLPNNCSVEIAANLIHSDVKKVVQNHVSTIKNEQVGLGFYVGGYNFPDTEYGELYKCEIPGEVHLERTTSDAGMVWSGQSEIVDRLILGYDPRWRQFSRQNASKGDFFNKLQPKLQLLINFPTMHLQDAIDLAGFLVNTTIEMQRISDGIVGMPGYIAGCGGTIEIAVITSFEGFQWVKHKTLNFPNK